MTFSKSAHCYFKLTLRLTVRCTQRHSFSVAKIEDLPQLYRSSLAAKRSKSVVFVRMIDGSAMAQIRVCGESVSKRCLWVGRSDC